MKRLFLAFLTLVIFQSCYYKPYLKYYTTGNKLPKFSKKEQRIGSMSPERIAYDITCYDWTVIPDFEDESLEGAMKISFKATAPESTILLDLQGRLKVDSIGCDNGNVRYKHKGDQLYLLFEKPLIPKEIYTLSIAYHGKPANVADEGPIIWSSDKSGAPFISTITQGIGPHYMMPCKDMLYDEPDSAFIRVAAPEGLKVVSNGKLVAITKEDGLSMHHWKVDNPINVYNLSFNIGQYVKVSYPYIDINGVKREIVAWALEEDSLRAFEFYSQCPPIMAEYENMLGVFPWWDDGCAFVETAINGGAMEHQSAISMGRILENNWQLDSLMHTNSTLIHELAHEWWGNSATAEDYCDAWLHEGLATYSEALIPERLYGKSSYNWKVNNDMKYVQNERPVQKTCGVRYNSWANGKDADIYNKGALFLHTLRVQLNDDSLFFDALRSIYSIHAKSSITTASFQSEFEEITKRDFTPYFEIYLEKNNPPTLEYYLDEENMMFHYKWKDPLPEDFKMKVLLGESDYLEIYPSNSYQEIKLRSEKDRSFKRELFGYVVISKDQKFKD